MGPDLVAHPLGRALQVDPIKPTLKATGTKRLKLKCDVLLSTFTFKFSLHHYSWATRAAPTACAPTSTSRQARPLLHPPLLFPLLPTRFPPSTPPFPRFPPSPPSFPSFPHPHFPPILPLLPPCYRSSTTIILYKPWTSYRAMPLIPRFLNSIACYDVASNVCVRSLVDGGCEAAPTAANSAALVRRWGLQPE